MDAALDAERLTRRLDGLLPGAGWSRAAGSLERSLLANLDTLATLLARAPELAKIAALIGRSEAADRERGAADGGSEEVVGVRYSGEVSRALPSELALLADPETEDLFYQRWVERQLLALELSGAGLDGVASPAERGPVIAAIDTSGSMEGAPELAAKALVLALAKRLLPQGRVLHLLLFGAEGQRTELLLRRRHLPLEPLLAFLAQRFQAGTDFDAPLLRALELTAERHLQGADVLVVTDGLCRATAAVIDAVQRTRDATGLRVWSVVLGGRDLSGVAPFSDTVWRFDPNETAAGLLPPALGRRG